MKIGEHYRFFVFFFFLWIGGSGCPATIPILRCDFIISTNSLQERNSRSGHPSIWKSRSTHVWVALQLLVLSEKEGPNMETGCYKPARRPREKAILTSARSSRPIPFAADEWWGRPCRLLCPTLFTLLPGLSSVNRQETLTLYATSTRDNPPWIIQLGHLEIKYIQCKDYPFFGRYVLEGCGDILNTALIQSSPLKNEEKNYLLIYAHVSFFSAWWRSREEFL